MWVCEEHFSCKPQEVTQCREVPTRCHSQPPYLGQVAQKSMPQFPLQYHKEIHAHKLEYEVFRAIYHGASHKGSVQLQSLMSVYPRVMGGGESIFHPAVQIEEGKDPIF